MEAYQTIPWTDVQADEKYRLDTKESGKIKERVTAITAEIAALNESISQAEAQIAENEDQKFKLLVESELEGVAPKEATKQFESVIGTSKQSIQDRRQQIRIKEAVLSALKQRLVKAEYDAKCQLAEQIKADVQAMTAKLLKQADTLQNQVMAISGAMKCTRLYNREQGLPNTPKLKQMIQEFADDVLSAVERGVPTHGAMGERLYDFIQ